MALVKYDNTNVVAPRGRAMIYVSERGLFSLHASTCEMMGLEVGDRVAFIHDEEEQEWYITNDAAAGFPLRDSASGKGLYFNNKAMAATILKHTSQEGDSIRFRVVEEPVSIENEDGSNSDAYCIIIPR